MLGRCEWSAKNNTDGQTIRNPLTEQRMRSQNHSFCVDMILILDVGVLLLMTRANSTNFQTN